ncbi:hypothetical protein WJX72_012319 [[Myrmecia] bisecta]|uniref:Uncharacterized protein n=1 Tax=[Myrmecia] bisecta TaxID=41462 RepID=A0AAW1PY21_9CHLO
MPQLIACHYLPKERARKWRWTHLTRTQVAPLNMVMPCRSRPQATRSALIALRPSRGSHQSTCLPTSGWTRSAA